MGDRRTGAASDEPNLELPSLFGRRKRKRRESEEQAAAENTAVLPAAPAGEPRDTEPTTPSYVDRGEAAPEPVTEPTAEAAPVHEAAPTYPAETDHRPTPTYPPEPGQEPAPASPAETISGRDEDEGRAAEQATSPASQQPAVAAPGGRRKVAEPRRVAERSRRTVPVLPAITAAVVTGLLVGLLGALLTWGSLRGCEAIRGTQTCGGPGFFLLVAIVVVMVLVGGVLLAAFKVAEPRSTSFLAVGILTVVVLVTLMEELFSPWMFVAVPVISAASYALARWVTTRYVDTTEPGPDHDVR